MAEYFHYMMEVTDSEGLTTTHGTFDYLVEAKDEAKKLIGRGVAVDVEIFKVKVTTEIILMETITKNG